MSILAACASTGFTTATTWALVDSTSFSGSEAAGTALTTSYVTSSTFTPGAITIDGIGVKLSNRTGTTGTITVALDLATADVAGTPTTINCSDLPAATTALLDGGWVFFKFSAPVTLAGATAYGVKAKTSSASQVTLFSTATTNWSRYLRTTTTQAPVAGDDMIIAKEWTAAATGTARSVTMDQTAATDYGSAPTAANGLVTPGIAICAGCDLTYGSTAATNYLLQLSNSLIVYNGGTLNIGTTGTPIPRDGSAVLQFDLAADGDYGLVARNGSTVNLQGLSRTSGKNVVSAKLTADSSVNLIQTVTIALTASTVTTATTTLDPTGTSLGVGSAASAFNILMAFSDTVANSEHRAAWTQAASVTAVTQVYTQWFKRGSGTNNRFIRLQLGSAQLANSGNGFYADFDLQAGTVGSCTLLGNGTATSAAITAFGGGFICTIIGKASSGAVAPISSVHSCNASTVVSYAGDATQNFICSWPQVYTLSAQPTQDTIDTDTGWLSGDVVALASTTRTAAECEVTSLNGNAGASTLTYNLYPVNARSGTSPTQAEVILLTRNVKVRSTNPTLMTYASFKSGSVVDIDWAEFYYVGLNVSGQRGVEVELNTTAATNFSMQFSSIHDTEVSGFTALVSAAGATITSLVFSSNTMWNLATVTATACQITATGVTATNWTFDSNIILRTGSGAGWNLADVGGTFTNNTVVGAANSGISLAETSAVIGTMTGNTVHSGASAGVIGASALGGTFGTLACWRNTSAGFSPTNVVDFILDTPTMFGNTTSNISITVAGGNLWIKSPILNGDTSFATSNNLNFAVVGASQVIVDNGDFSTVTGIKTAASNDIAFGAALTFGSVILRNTKLGAATEVANPSNLSNNGFIASEKHDGTAGNHLTYMRNGLVQTDTTIFNISTTSQRMTPTSATLKLESAYQFQGLKVAVNSGSTVTVSVYTRKSVVGDGVAYNGNQPRLILKANPAIGISTDTVIATASVAAGSWGQISGTTAAATDNGAFEFVVDVDGTAGWVNQGDWSAA